MTTNNPSKVKIFGAPWCAPCKQLKTGLDRLGISYEYVDIETHPQRMPAGFTSVPVVEFPNGTCLPSPAPRKIAEMLTAA